MTVTPIRRGPYGGPIPLDHDGQPCINSTDLCQRTGITFRQLDYWVRTGRLTPTHGNNQGAGTSRWFARRDAHLIGHVKHLLDHGLAIGPAFHVAHQLVDRTTAQLGPFTITTTTGDEHP